MVRVLSPPGGSTLITSAPRSPRISPHDGPMIMCENSTTRMPVSGRRAADGRDFLIFRLGADLAVFLVVFFLAMRNPCRVFRRQRSYKLRHMNEIARIAPLTIRMHERDNVAIVANDGGLPAGTVLTAGSGCASMSRRRTKSR